MFINVHSWFSYLKKEMESWDSRSMQRLEYAFVSWEIWFCKLFHTLPRFYIFSISSYHFLMPNEILSTKKPVSFVLIIVCRLESNEELNFRSCIQTKVQFLSLLKNAPKIAKILIIKVIFHSLKLVEVVWKWFFFRKFNSWIGSNIRCGQQFTWILRYFELDLQTNETKQLLLQKSPQAISMFFFSPALATWKLHSLLWSALLGKQNPKLYTPRTINAWIMLWHAQIVHILFTQQSTF